MTDIINELYTAKKRRETAKTCRTCARFKGGRCKVLLAKVKNCWAWTSNPDWEKELKKATEAYAKRMKGES